MRRSAASEWVQRVSGCVQTRSCVQRALVRACLIGSRTAAAAVAKDTPTYVVQVGLVRPSGLQSDELWPSRLAHLGFPKFLQLTPKPV